MIYSLDIFDTLILRKETPEATLARLPEDIRESRLALHKADYPTSLQEFYRGTDYSIDQEVELEIDSLQANDDMLRFVERNKQHTFILVSDMYLSSEQLEYILKQLGIPQFYEKLYVSCEYQSSKQNFGKLFDCVIKDYGNEITHVGDNFKSDFYFAAMKLVSAWHYVKQETLYSPSYQDPESYYNRFAEEIVAPIVWLSVEKIREIVAARNIKSVVCLGSVYDFYKDVFAKLLPDLEVKKLEISRFNIMFMLYQFNEIGAFVRKNHTGAFLEYYYPQACQSRTLPADASFVDKWKMYREVLEENHQDLSEKSTATYAEFEQQLADKSLADGDVLFVDFGYQGSFCELLQTLPVFKDKNCHLFLSVKEANKKLKCDYGVQVQPFQMSNPMFRNPFWILDAEILIKNNNVTPLAYKNTHASSKGWPEIYTRIVNSVCNFDNPRSVYVLERELEYKILHHMCTITDKYFEVFNWLCTKVGYAKYSMREDAQKIIDLSSGACQININNLLEFEREKHGFSYMMSDNTAQKPDLQRNHTLYYFSKYLESIEAVKRHLV